MITVSKIASAGSAMAYYSERDDYYREGGGAPAEFYGRGADQLDLIGALKTRRDAERFAADSRVLAQGRTRLGTRRGMTSLSAPPRASASLPWSTAMIALSQHMTWPSKLP